MHSQFFGFKGFYLCWWCFFSVSLYKIAFTCEMWMVDASYGWPVSIYSMVSTAYSEVGKNKQQSSLPISHLQWTKCLNLPITPSQRPKCINWSSAHCNSSAWMDDWGSTPKEFRLPSDIAFCRFLVMSTAALSVCTSRLTITLPCLSEVTYWSQVSNCNTFSLKFLVLHEVTL